MKLLFSDGKEIVLSPFQLKFIDSSFLVDEFEEIPIQYNLPPLFEKMMLAIDNPILLVSDEDDYVDASLPAEIVECLIISDYISSLSLKLAFLLFHIQNAVGISEGLLRESDAIGVITNLTLQSLARSVNETLYREIEFLLNFYCPFNFIESYKNSVSGYLLATALFEKKDFYALRNKTLPEGSSSEGRAAEGSSSEGRSTEEDFTSLEKLLYRSFAIFDLNFEWYLNLISVVSPIYFVLNGISDYSNVRKFFKKGGYPSGVFFPGGEVFLFPDSRISFLGDVKFSFQIECEDEKYFVFPEKEIDAPEERAKQIFCEIVKNGKCIFQFEGETPSNVCVFDGDNTYLWDRVTDSVTQQKI